MGLFDDCNKTDLTKQVTAATCSWLDERGCKPVETEVPVAYGWVADIASVVCPTDTELAALKLIRRKPAWKKPAEERQAWASEAAGKSRLMTLLVEVKTSRSDFVGDRKWILPVPADLCWLAVPRALVRESEWPAGWGILEYYQGRGCMVTKRPPTIRQVEHEQQRDLIYAVACRRDNQTRYEHLRRIQRQQREDLNAGRSLTRVRQAVKAALSIAYGEHGSIEEVLERNGIRNVPPWVLDDMRALWNCMVNPKVMAIGAGE